MKKKHILVSALAAVILTAGLLLTACSQPMASHLEFYRTYYGSKEVGVYDIVSDIGGGRVLTGELTLTVENFDKGTPVTVGGVSREMTEKNYIKVTAERAFLENGDNTLTEVVFWTGLNDTRPAYVYEKSRATAYKDGEKQYTTLTELNASYGDKKYDYTLISKKLEGKAGEDESMEGGVPKNGDFKTSEFKTKPFFNNIEDYVVFRGFAVLATKGAFSTTTFGYSVPVYNENKLAAITAQIDPAAVLQNALGKDIACLKMTLTRTNPVVKGGSARELYYAKADVYAIDESGKITPDAKWIEENGVGTFVPGANGGGDIFATMVLVKIVEGKTTYKLKSYTKAE